MDARRLIPVGTVVTALLVLAGIASHGRPLSPGRGAGPSASFFDYVATTLVILAVAMAVVVAWIVRSDRVGGAKPRRRRWHVWTQILIIAGALALAELVIHSRFEQRIRQLASRVPPQQTHGRRSRAPAGPTHLRNARLRWDEIAIVLVLVAGIGVYFYVTRPARRPLRATTRRREAVSHALDESLDDLRTEPDIRRAIIAAYARMEHALGTAGLERRPSETPFEYLARSLEELDTGAAAARRLTDLFERAKFSHHEPADSMRDEAIDALVAVRDDLRAPAPEPVTA